MSVLHHVTSNAPCNPKYTPLAVFTIILYILAYTIGWGPVPFVLLAKLLALRVRGFVGGIATFDNLFTTAIFTFYYIDYYLEVHLWFTWWIFAVTNSFLSERQKENSGRH